MDCIDLFKLSVFPSKIVDLRQCICHIHSCRNVTLYDCKNRIINNGFLNAMGRAGVLVVLVSPTDEVGIFVTARACNPTNHRATTIRTEDFSRKRMHTFCSDRASCIVLHKPLDEIELRWSNNGIVRVLCP